MSRRFSGSAWRRLKLTDIHMSNIFTLARNLVTLFSVKVADKPDAIEYKGCYLPRVRSNESLSDNTTYLESAIEMVDGVDMFTRLEKTTNVLDFGSGQGRFANGLILSGKTIGKYIGIDTDSASVQWCKSWISEKHDAYKFIHLTALNQRYNPNGGELQVLPMSDENVNLVVLNSVFSHMLTRDIEFYLKEFSRVLEPEGALYLTAFIEEGVSDVEENPDGYLGRKSVGALHRVRYEKNYFIKLVEDAGFGQITYSHRAFERTGQSLVTANKC